MMSTTKFALGFALSLVTGTTVLSQPPSEPTAAWFGQCLRCEWDPWGGPAFCAVAGGGVPVTPLPPPDDLAGG
jgi:hypothetical protein